MAIEIVKPNLGDRFWSKVKVTPGGCWEWLGARVGGGYGHYYLDGKMVYAHILSYEDKHGPVPDGMELDHKCRNPGCVNPDHVEPVTHRENNLRGVLSNGRSQRTHCPQGHPYDDKNTYVNPRGERQCRACMREASRRYKDRVRA